jgi:hypothetical protein
MGVLSDLIVAPPVDAERVGRASLPDASIPSVDVKGIDTVKLGVLHEILTGTSFDELLEQYDPAYEGSDEGPWVFVLPAELVASLAKLDSGDRRTVAAKWAQAEEFALDGWSLSDVATGLDVVCEQACAAVSAGKALLLRMSL